MTNAIRKSLVLFRLLTAGTPILAFAYGSGGSWISRCPKSAMATATGRPSKRFLTSLKLAAKPVGPVARAKKMMDPEDYDRVVREKMRRDGLTREEAEGDYNEFLENPYYVLDKKEKYYKSLGYGDVLDGMIGEAEKEGRGDEVRERVENFRRENKVKALSVLTVFVASFLYFRSIYQSDPDNFLPGI